MKRFFPKIALPKITLGRVVAVVSLLGMAVLCFLAGAAVMHFNLPASKYLHESFSGAKEFLAPKPAAVAEVHDLSKAAVTVDNSGATCDGFTLVTTTNGADAMLLDMRGQVVHRWKMPERRPWPHTAKVSDPKAEDHLLWQRCYLYPNGDLLALCCSGVGSPYGYGLAKLDKDSKVLWGYSANVHHDFDVGDDGRIYVLTHNIEQERPEGFEWVRVPYIADRLVVLSPDGKEQASLPLLEAFRDTPYALLARAPDRPPGLGPGHDPMGAAPGPGGASKVSDPLHANSVSVLTPALAPKFGAFKPGQILVSLRTPSVLAVLDLEARSAVWAARGVWQLQHSAQFLDNGRILLFDNSGAGLPSRVVEYDPLTHGVPWWYGGDKYDKASRFGSGFRGATQRLPNGNTLIVVSDERRILEVTTDKELVWEWSVPGKSSSTDPLSITGAWRYRPSQVPFLKNGTRPRES